MSSNNKIICILITSETLYFIILNILFAFQALLFQVPSEPEDQLRPFSPTEEDIDKLLKPSTLSPRKQRQNHQVSVPKFTLPGAMQEEEEEEEEEEGRKGAGLGGRSLLPRDGKGLMSSDRMKQQKIISEW